MWHEVNDIQPPDNLEVPSGADRYFDCVPPDRLAVGYDRFEDRVIIVHSDRDGGSHAMGSVFWWDFFRDEDGQVRMNDAHYKNGAKDQVTLLDLMAVHKVFEKIDAEKE